MSILKNLSNGVNLRAPLLNLLLTHEDDVTNVMTLYVKREDAGSLNEKKSASLEGKMVSPVMVRTTATGILSSKNGNI